MNKSISVADLRNRLECYVLDYPQKSNERDFWRTPLLVTARTDKRFTILPKIAAENHWRPEDLLKSARAIIVFFMPFKEEIVEENHPGKFPCPNWGLAYEATNRLIENACGQLRDVLEASGHAAMVTPATEDSVLMARWSHKHLGHLAGLGRLGINAQLITPSGCAGRLGSLVTDADLGDHPLITKPELCLYKIGQECLKCIPRCPVGAVSIEGINRQRCNKRLQFNFKHRGTMGLGENTHGCGKCQVNLPCSLRDPTTSESGILTNIVHRHGKTGATASIPMSDRGKPKRPRKHISKRYVPNLNQYHIIKTRSKKSKG